MEKNLEDRWPAMLGPLCPELRDEPSLNGECSLVPDCPPVGLKEFQKQDNQSQDEVMFL